MFSNMNSMAISSGRESDFFKGIKSKHSEAFECLFWHSLGKYEHLTLKTTLEFNMPLAAHVSNISMTFSQIQAFAEFSDFLGFREVLIMQCEQFLPSSIAFLIFCTKRSAIRHTRQYCERKISLYTNVPTNVKLWNSTK